MAATAPETHFGQAGIVAGIYCLPRVEEKGSGPSTRQIAAVMFWRDKELHAIEFSLGAQVFSPDSNCHLPTLVASVLFW